MEAIKRAGLDKKMFSFNERVEIDLGDLNGRLTGKIAGISSQQLITIWIVILDEPMMGGSTAITVHESMMTSLEHDERLNEFERRLVRDVQPIHAIKAFRARTGATLARAKRLVDEFKAR